MIILTRWYDSRHEKDRAWQQTFIWYVCYGIAVIAATRYSRSRRCTWRFACTRRARVSRSRDRTTLYLLFCKCNHCWHSVRDRRSLPGKEYLIRLVLFPHYNTYIVPTFSSLHALSWAFMCKPSWNLHETHSILSLHWFFHHYRSKGPTSTGSLT